jgi:predicted lipoprotein with Yx(FWY)xxD motif
MPTLAGATMRRPAGLAAILASVALGAAACGGEDEAGVADERAKTATSASETGSRTVASAPASKRRGSTVKATGSRYGRILADRREHTLYLFTRDQQKQRSRCYGACAKAWPPLYTKGRPRAGSGAQAGRLGTTRRRDGRLQVTYNGHPLYYYVSEDEPREILCQDVDEFGGTWLVVSPNGEAVQ